MVKRIIQIVKVKDLPSNKRNELGYFKGLVEIRIEKNSPFDVQIEPIDGTFSERIKWSMDNEGLTGKKVFK